MAMLGNQGRGQDHFSSPLQKTGQLSRIRGAGLYDQVPGPVLASMSLSGQMEGGVLWYESVLWNLIFCLSPSPCWEGGTEVGLHLGL